MTSHLAEHNVLLLYNNEQTLKGLKQPRWFRISCGSHNSPEKFIPWSAWKSNHHVLGWSVYDVFEDHFRKKTGRGDVPGTDVEATLDKRKARVEIFSLTVTPCDTFPSVNIHICDVVNESCTWMSNPQITLLDKCQIHQSRQLYCFLTRAL